HRRYALQLEARERAAVGDELALALYDMEAHARLPILERGEFLRTRGRDGAVARNDLLDEPAHRFDAERKRDDVEEQPVLALRLVAGKHVRLHGGAQRHYLVRVEVVERIALEELRHCALDLRHARGAADHHHALDVADAQSRLAQRLPHRPERLLHERLRDAAEGFGVDGYVDELSGGKARRDRRLAVRGEMLLRLARLDEQEAHVARRERRELRLLHRPAEHALAEVVAAEKRVAARCHDFEYAARQFQNR